jgi:hypothetical protein
LKEVRKFLFGFTTTARIMRMLPGILVRIKMMDILAVVNDNSAGGSMAKHLLSNVLSITIISILHEYILKIIFIEPKNNFIKIIYRPTPGGFGEILPEVMIFYERLRRRILYLHISFLIV